MLTTPSDYSSIQWDDMGFDTQPNWETFLNGKIKESYLWLQIYVPLTTLEDAHANLLANTADQVDEFLRLAEYYRTLWNIQNYSMFSNQVEQAKVGNVSVKMASETTLANLVTSLDRNAWRYLRQAGFSEEVIGFAGLRSGNPLDN